MLLPQIQSSYCFDIQKKEICLKMQSYCNKISIKTPRHIIRPTELDFNLNINLDQNSILNILVLINAKKCIKVVVSV